MTRTSGKPSDASHPAGRQQDAIARFARLREAERTRDALPTRSADRHASEEAVREARLAYEAALLDLAHQGDSESDVSPDE